MIVQNIKHIEFNEDKKQCNAFKKNEHHSWSFVRTHTKNRTTMQYTFFQLFSWKQIKLLLFLVLFNKRFLTLAMIIVRSHYSSPLLLIWQSNRPFRISKQLFRWKVKLKFLQEFLFSAAILFLFLFCCSFIWYETAQPDFAIFGQIIPELLQKQPYHDS